MITRELILKNDVGQLVFLHEFVDLLGEEAEWDFSTTMSLNLVIQEAVCNIIRYAYGGEKGCRIEIRFVQDDERLSFTVIDSGVPFDPTVKEDPDVTLPLEDRPVGGLGIFLMRKLMDELNYRREAGCNVLHMVRYLKV